MRYNAKKIKLVVVNYMWKPHLYSDLIFVVRKNSKIECFLSRNKVSHSFNIC